MLKYLSIFLTTLFFTVPAKCQFPGAPIFYYKNTSPGFRQVYVADSCDFFSVILPPDSGEKLLNIKEYYRNGQLKMAGKARRTEVNTATGWIKLEGESISFYPSGKREHIVNHHNSRIEGFEIWYYPDGKLFYTLNYNQGNGDFLFWEFYDKNGKIICENGNGKWIKYNDDYTEILEEGAVKDGFAEGEWRGTTHLHDHIKYGIVYKKSIFKSGIGYDKAGNAYPFKELQEPPRYKHGYFEFFDDIKRNLKVPRDGNGKKMSVDTIKISFIIEKDGHLTHCEALGNVDPNLSAAIADALTQCKDWSCRKYYGVPLRSKFILPIKYFESWDIAIDTKTFDYTENILED